MDPSQQPQIIPQPPPLQILQDLPSQNQQNKQEDPPLLPHVPNVPHSNISNHSNGPHSNVTKQQSNERDQTLLKCKAVIERLNQQLEDEQRLSEERHCQLIDLNETCEKLTNENEGMKQVNQRLNKDYETQVIKVNALQRELMDIQEKFNEQACSTQLNSMLQEKLTKQNVYNQELIHTLNGQAEAMELKDQLASDWTQQYDQIQEKIKEVEEENQDFKEAYQVLKTQLIQFFRNLKETHQKLSYLNHNFNTVFQLSSQLQNPNPNSTIYQQITNYNQQSQQSHQHQLNQISQQNQQNQTYQGSSKNFTQGPQGMHNHNSNQMQENTSQSASQTNVPYPGTPQEAASQNLFQDISVFLDQEKFSQKMELLSQKKIQEITRELDQLIEELKEKVQSQMKYPKEFKDMQEENNYLGKRVEEMDEQFRILQEVNQERMREEEQINEVSLENDKNKEELERLQLIVEEQNQVIDQYNNLLEKEKSDNQIQIEELYSHNQQLQIQLEEVVKERDEYLLQLESYTKEVQELKELGNIGQFQIKHNKSNELKCPQTQQEQKLFRPQNQPFEERKTQGKFHQCHSGCSSYDNEELVRKLARKNEQLKEELKTMRYKLSKREDECKSYLNDQKQLKEYFDVKLETVRQEAISERQEKNKYYLNLKDIKERIKELEQIYKEEFRKEEELLHYSQTKLLEATQQNQRHDCQKQRPTQHSQRLNNSEQLHRASSIYKGNKDFDRQQGKLQEPNYLKGIQSYHERDTNESSYRGDSLQDDKENKGNRDNKRDKSQRRMKQEGKGGNGGLGQQGEIIYKFRSVINKFEDKLNLIHQKLYQIKFD